MGIVSGKLCRAGYELPARHADSDRVCHYKLLNLLYFFFPSDLARRLRIVVQPNVATAARTEQI
jgi:hypothetical protein